MQKRKINLDGQLWAAVGVIFMGLAFISGLIFWMDSNNDRQIADLRVEIRSEINQNETDRKAEMMEVRDLIKDLIAKLDDEGDDFSNKIDANTSEIRSEMSLYDERLRCELSLHDERLLDMMNIKYQNLDRRITLLEEWVASSKSGADGG